VVINTGSNRGGKTNPPQKPRYGSLGQQLIYREQSPACERNRLRGTAFPQTVTKTKLNGARQLDRSKGQSPISLGALVINGEKITVRTPKRPKRANNNQLTTTDGNYELKKKKRCPPGNLERSPPRSRQPSGFNVFEQKKYRKVKHGKTTLRLILAVWPSATPS